MSTVKSIWVWFFCNHHTLWERADSPCFDEHKKSDVVWGPEQPCRLYRDGQHVGNYGVVLRWEPCDSCISQSATWEEEIRETEEDEAKDEAKDEGAQVR